MKTTLQILFIYFLLWLTASCSTHRHSVSTDTSASTSLTVLSEKSDSLSLSTSELNAMVEQSVDSVLVDRTRVVREADSTELSAYGIHIRGSEKAFVVLEKEVRDRVRQLTTTTEKRSSVQQVSDRRMLDSVRTSSVAVSVAKDTERKLSNHNFYKFAISIGLTLFVLTFVTYLRKRVQK